MICWSESPRRSISRTWFFRSIARPALESAMVWFWQTRHRSSAVIRTIRASSSGSAAAGAASWAATTPAASANTRAMIHLAIELPHQRFNLVPDHLGCQRPNVFETDHALAVHHEGFWHAINAPVDPDPAVLVEQRDGVRVAVARQPAQARHALVLVVQTVDRLHLLAGEFDQQRVLRLTGHTPRRPHVQHPDLAHQVVTPDGAVGIIEPGELESGRGLVDQRGRHFLGV